MSHQSHKPQLRQLQQKEWVMVNDVYDLHEIEKAVRAKYSPPFR